MDAYKSCSLLIDGVCPYWGTAVLVFRSLIRTNGSGSPVDTIIGLIFGFCGIFILSADAPGFLYFRLCEGEGSSSCAISIIMFFSCFGVGRATGRLLLLFLVLLFSVVSGFISPSVGQRLLLLRVHKSTSSVGVKKRT